MNDSKHILIIGGMGPQASAFAHRRLVEEFQLAHRDGELGNADYPRIMHLSINVDDFIADPGKKLGALNYINACLRDINLESVDCGFIACNTAHLLFDDLQQTTGGRLISMIETVKESVAGQKIGLVATPATISSGLYGEAIAPDEAGVLKIEEIIRQVISGVPARDLAGGLQIEIEKLKNRGAEKVILGCSELSILGEFINLDYIIDPVTLIARKVIE